MAGELIPSDFTHGYYEFDGQVSNEIVDLSDAGFNLSVVGAVDVSTGKFSNGLEFDGDNDYASSAQSRFADLTDQLGICGWLQPLRTATGVDAYIWKGRTGGTGQDIVLFGNSDTAGHYRINNGNDSGVTAAMGTADPFFFALNYDGADATIYWDDPSINSSGAFQTGNIRNTSDFYLGGVSDAIYANCRWSQLGIRNAPFTADEMAFMYNSGVGRLLSEVVEDGTIIFRRRREGY